VIAFKDKTVNEFAKRCKSLTWFDVSKTSATAEGVRTAVLRCGPWLNVISVPYGVDPFSYDNPSQV
jgi:hypothetical protein